MSAERIEVLKMLMYLQVIETNEEKRKFVIIYEKYRYLMFKVANDVLNDKYWAEDAVHEAFVKVAYHMEKIGEPDARETKRFLITITKNTAIDIYRKRNRQMKVEISTEILEKREEVFYVETETDNRILDILKNLPDKYRDVFLLKYSSNLDNYEVAEVLGLTEGTVRQRISRGKKMIQESLEKLGEEIS